jgi:hypothetical protein
MGLKLAFRRWRFKRKVREFVKFFAVLDQAISDNNPRWKRQQFWHDFWTSEEFRRAMRKKLPSILLKDLK